MRRWLFNILAAVSLVMTVMTAAMWVRSYFVGDSFGVVNLTVNLADTAQVNNTATGIATGEGRVAFGTLSNGTITGSSTRTFRHRFWGWNSGGLIDYQFVGLNPGPSYDWGYLGFDVHGFDSAPGSISWLVYVPYWFLLLGFAALPVYRAMMRRRWRWQRRQHRGLCGNCGYNLTGNASGACPECGTAIPPRPSSPGASA